MCDFGGRSSNNPTLCTSKTLNDKDSNAFLFELMYKCASITNVSICVAPSSRFPCPMDIPKFLSQHKALVVQVKIAWYQLMVVDWNQSCSRKISHLCVSSFRPLVTCPMASMSLDTVHTSLWRTAMWNRFTRISFHFRSVHCKSTYSAPTPCSFTVVFVAYAT